MKKYELSEMERDIGQCICWGGGVTFTLVKTFHITLTLFLMRTIEITM